MLIELTLFDETGPIYINPAHICSIQPGENTLINLANKMYYEVIETPQEIYHLMTSMAGHANLLKRPRDASV